MPTDLGPDWWAALVEAFIAELRRDNRALDTINGYYWALAQLGRFLLVSGVVCAEQLAREHIEGWADQLRRGPLAERSRSLVASRIRTFLTWAAEEGAIAPQVRRGVPRIRMPAGVARPVPPEDLARLQAYFAEAPPGANLNILCTRAAFWFTLASGGRISEVLQVRRAEYQGRSAFVVQKGGSEKMLQVGEFTDLAVQQYLNARVDSHPALFCQHRTRTGEALPLLDKTLNYRWLVVSRRLGIRKFTSHQLRHTMGSAIYAKTHDLQAVATKLGHSSLNSARGYAKVDHRYLEGFAELVEPKRDAPPEARPAILPPISRRRRRSA